MKKITDKFVDILVRALLVWTIFAIGFQVTMLTLSVVNPELETKIGNEIMWKLDGTFNK